MVIFLQSFVYSFKKIVFHQLPRQSIAGACRLC
jgi:hypothetical protein